jgi:hypothetical protein
MTWLGVPILDWVILAGLLVLGVEAWFTTRPSTTDSRAGPQSPTDPGTPSAAAPRAPSDA